MDWLSANWFWILIGVAFFAMHMFGHGGHGRHGGHSEDDGKMSGGPLEKREENRPGGHHH